MQYTITQVLEELREQMTENLENFKNAEGVASMIPDVSYYLRARGMGESPFNLLLMAHIANDLVTCNKWDGFSALVLQGLMATAICTMQTQEFVDAAISTSN